MSKVNSGNDQQALQMGGGGIGYAGTATATSATSLTATGTPWVASQWIGHVVVASSGVYGVITANTTSVLTIVRWYNAASPGGTAGTTPAGTTTFTILPVGAPCYFMGLSTTNSAAVATDTTMAGEITTAGGGLIRYPAVYGHTAGNAGYTLTGTFTANGSDALTETAYRIGVFTDLTGGIMQFETLLNAPASFAAVGDQAVVTHSISN